MTPLVKPDAFPSSEWFEDLASDPSDRPDVYHSLGFADFRLIVEIVDPPRPPRSFALVLDGYDVSFAGEIEDPSQFAPDATISGALGDWREMVENIVDNAGADRSHTLNALSLAEFPLRVTSDDPMGRDKFFRYAETLQTLFDATGRRTSQPA